MILRIIGAQNTVGPLGPLASPIYLGNKGHV